MNQILTKGYYDISDSENAFILEENKKIERKEVPLSETRTRRTRTESKLDDYDYVIENETKNDEIDMFKDENNYYTCFYCSDIKPIQYPSSMIKHIKAKTHKESVEKFNNKYSNFILLSMFPNMIIGDYKINYISYFSAYMGNRNKKIVINKEIKIDNWIIYHDENIQNT